MYLIMVSDDTLPAVEMTYDLVHRLGRPRRLLNLRLRYREDAPLNLLTTISGAVLVSDERKRCTWSGMISNPRISHSFSLAVALRLPSSPVLTVSTNIRLLNFGQNTI